MHRELLLRLRRSAVAGTLTVVGLVILELLFAQIRAWTLPADVISWLLCAGTAVTLLLGFDRFHDFGFWGISIVIDWFVFAGLFFAVLSWREKKPN